MTLVDDEVVALAGKPGRGRGFMGTGRRGGSGKRYVRTPEGSNKYGLPIGSLITRDAELRAKAKGNTYDVPEDGGGEFGAQPPAAGKTKRDPADLVKAIRSAPAPKPASPEGPKKVAVGNAGYGFPDGSRTFRPVDHENIAIVRTPDYQLVAVSDKGVAIELEGDLEKELNDELDGDLSENYTTDEPATPEQEQDAADRAAQDEAEAAGIPPEEEAEPVPDSPEQMPGYLSDERIDAIIEGMKASGLDQNTLNAAELALHQNNKQIRQEHADAKAKESEAAPDVEPELEDAEEEAAPPAPPLPVPTKPGEKPAATPDLRTRPDGVNTLRPEDQKKRDDKMYDDAAKSATKPSSTSRKDGKIGQHADNIDRRQRAQADEAAPAKPAAKPASNRRANAQRRPRQDQGDGRPTDDQISQMRDLSDQQRAAKAPKQESAAESQKKLDALEQLATARSTGVAEGTVSGNKVSLRRNRVSGEMEYSIENEDGTSETFTDPKELVQAAQKKSAEKSDKAEAAKKPARNQIVTLPGGERALVLGEDDDGNVRVHTGTRGEASLPAEDLKVVRSNDDSGAGAKLVAAREALDDADLEGATAVRDDVQDFLDDEYDDDVVEDISEPEDMTQLSPEELAAIRSDGKASQARRVAARREESRRAKGARPASTDRSQARQKKTAQDTTETPASELSDTELNALLSDIDDFHATSSGTAASRARRAEVYKEWTKRNPPPPLPPKTGTAASGDDDDSEFNAIPKPAYWGQMDATQRKNWETRQRRAIQRRKKASQTTPTPAPDEGNEAETLSTDVRGPDAAPLDAAERRRLGIQAGKGEFSDRVSGRDEILNAKEGDKFVSRGAGGRAEQVWEVRDDGRVHNLTNPDVSLSRDEFADLDTGMTGSPEVYSFSGNKTNDKSIDLAPGDTASRDWADNALPGAASYSADDGLVQEKNLDGTISTPIGDLEPEDFDASDVEGTDSTVVRNQSDGRPVGASRELTTADDLKGVKSGDGIAIVTPDGGQIDARRLDDGSVEVDLDGLKAVIPAEAVLETSSPVWHVPNRDAPGTPTKKKWSVGDTLQSLDDLLAQKVGTKLRYKYKKPIKGKTESEYTVLPEGEIKSDIGTVLPAFRIQPAVLNGQVSVKDLPADDVEVDATPREVTDPADYVDGDKIIDYRHLKDMAPGEQVTLVVPAHKNGGQEAHVVLTRTDDNKVMGGYMFSIGRRGRGYNSFGENNASIFQAIHDGRLYNGDITRPEDNLLDPTVEGAWDKTANIDAWPGGPKVSEHDLQSFIASQVYSPAMQTGYFDQSRLPLNNPFQNKAFRNTFSQHAMKEYNQPNNPYRDKPASIRYAAQHLGLRYDDPGSALIPDDLEFADFKKTVDVGASWYPSGIPAEGPTMGEEKIKVTVADVKTALAVLDNMLESDNPQDADKILKRVFARQGSPLQNMNTSVAIAAYFQMKRTHHKDGSVSTKPARSDDKRKNAELMRQMLREQAEGREPGYYGVPDDDTFEIQHKGNKYFGTMATHSSGLTRPAVNSDNDPNSNKPAAGSPMDSQTSPPDVTPAAPNIADEPIPEGEPVITDEADTTPAAPTVPDFVGGTDTSPAPEEPQDTLLTADDFAAIPAGNDVLNPLAGTTYEKQDDGTWRARGWSDIVITNDQMAQSAEFSGAYRDLNGEETRAPAENEPEGNPPAEDEPEPSPLPLEIQEREAKGPPMSAIEKKRHKHPHKLFLEDENGNIFEPKTYRHIPDYWNRAYVYGHSLPWSERRGVFELDRSETQLYVDTAERHGLTVDPADLQGKRLFITEEGDGVGWLDGDEMGGMAVDRGSTNAAENLVPAMVARGGRVALSDDNPNLSLRLSSLGMRSQSFVIDPKGGRAQISYYLDPDYIGSAPSAPFPGMRTKDRDTALQEARDAFAEYETSDFHMAADKGRDGGEHIKDANGQKTKLWGKYGASGLIMRHTDATSGEERFLLVQRAGNKKNGNFGKWQLPGGGLDEKETDEQGAARETVEETNPPPEFLRGLKLVGNNRVDDPNLPWHYSNLTADTPEMYDPVLNRSELADAKWLTRAEISQMEADGELHAALASSIRDSLATFGGTPQNALPAPARPPAPPQAPTPAPDLNPTEEAATLDLDAPDDIPPIGADAIAPVDLPHAPAVTRLPLSQAVHYRGKAGSNPAGFYHVKMSDGTTRDYYVKTVAPTPDGQERARQEVLATELYRLTGAKTPDVDYDENEGNYYSEIVDHQSQGTLTKAENQRQLARDAWLANWDAAVNDNTVALPNGEALHIDNGGALEMRARSDSPKKGVGGGTGGRAADRFDGTVTELDSLLKHNGGYYGMSPGQTLTPEALEGAQSVVDVSDVDIRDTVSKNNLPDSLATTLIARRDYIAKQYSLTPTQRSAAPAPPPAPTPEAPAAPEAPAPEAPAAPEPEAPPAPAGPAPTHASYVDAGATQITDTTGIAPTIGEHFELPMSDGTTKGFAVISPKNTEQGRALALTSALYQELGVGSVASDYNDSEDKVYTEHVAVGADRGAAGHDDFRQGFVMDAWLSNREAAGKGRFIYDDQGNPIRLDNRASLDMRLGGGKKTDFDGVVTDLESLRDPNVNAQAASVYGQRQNGKVDDFELTGAQKVVDLSDDRIRELVSETGADPALADTLIERKNYIADYYGLSELANAPAVDDVNEADSLASARRAVGNRKPTYVRANLPQGTEYLDYLRAEGGLDQAFEAAWRAQNPEKPDRSASGGIVTTRNTTGMGNPDADIDLALEFDFSPETLQQARDDTGNPSASLADPTLLAIWRQREFDAKPKVEDWTTFEALTKKQKVKHVFRTVNAGGGKTADQIADELRSDEMWWPGLGAYGNGVYTAEEAADSFGYGTKWIDMALDLRTANVTSESAMKTRVNTIWAAVQKRTDLTTEQKDWLSLNFNWQDPRNSYSVTKHADGYLGRAASILGYDVISENGIGYHVVLNRDILTFNEYKPDAATHPGYGTKTTMNQAAIDRRARNQPSVAKRTGTSVPKAPAPQGAPTSGTAITAKDLDSVAVGDVVEYTRKDGTTIQYRKGANGWEYVSSSKPVAWMNNIKPTSRARFVVV